jgi:hypothetical protein
MLKVIIDNQPDDEACEYHLFVENLIDLLAEMEGLEEELYEFEEVYEDYEELEEGKSKTRKKKKKRRKKKKKKSKSGPAPGSRHYKCQQKAKRTYKVWPSAYSSGAVVKCRRGDIWKNLEESKSYEELLEVLLESDSVVVSPNKYPETLEEVYLFERKKWYKKEGLRKWFSRKGAPGKSSGWVDCNTCRRNKKTGRMKCKPCGRKKGEKRAKYPSCRPTPGKCKDKGRGKTWGKKSKKRSKKKSKKK